MSKRRDRKTAWGRRFRVVVMVQWIKKRKRIMAVLRLKRQSSSARARMQVLASPAVAPDGRRIDVRIVSADSRGIATTLRWLVTISPGGVYEERVFVNPVSGFKRTTTSGAVFLSLGLRSKEESRRRFHPCVQMTAGLGAGQNSAMLVEQT